MFSFIKVQEGLNPSKSKSEFEMKDLGQAKRIIGMEIERDTDNYILMLKQGSYVKKIFENFSML